MSEIPTLGQGGAKTLRKLTASIPAQNDGAHLWGSFWTRGFNMPPPHRCPRTPGARGGTMAVCAYGVEMLGNAVPPHVKCVGSKRGVLLGWPGGGSMRRTSDVYSTVGHVYLDWWWSSP